MALTVDQRPQPCQEAEPWTPLVGTVDVWQPRPVPKAKTPMSQLVDATLNRLERETRDRGEKWSERALELKHGVSQGTFSKLRKGIRGTVDAKTLPSIAAALGLPIEVLTGGKPESRPRPPLVASPTPPPATVTAATATVVSDDDTDAMIAEAARGLGFEYDDAVAVRPLVRERAALARSREENLDVIRAWLAVARDLRLAGESTAKQAIIAEVSLRSAKTDRRSREAAQALSDATDAALRARGHEPPAEPSPAAQKTLEARKKRQSRDEG